MSDTVAGPDAEAFAIPNTLEIESLQLQIQALEKAKHKADGQRKRDAIVKQIAQLTEQQAILYGQMAGDADLDTTQEFDIAKFRTFVKKRTGGLEAAGK